MIVDEIEIINKTAKRLGMPTTQVTRVVDAYLDEHLAAARRSKVAAQLADQPAESPQDGAAADAGTPTKAPRKRAPRKATAPVIEDFQKAAEVSDPS